MENNWGRWGLKTHILSYIHPKPTHMVFFVSSTNKTDRHDIVQILLNVALNTIDLFYVMEKLSSLRKLVSDHIVIFFGQYNMLRLLNWKSSDRSYIWKMSVCIRVTDCILICLCVHICAIDLLSLRLWLGYFLKISEFVSIVRLWLLFVMHITHQCK